MNQALATEPPTSLDILWTFGNWRTLWIYKWTFSMDLFPAFLPVSYFTGDPPFLNRCSELMVIYNTTLQVEYGQVPPQSVCYFTYP